MQSNQTNYFYFILYKILRKDIYIVNYRIMLITIYYLRGLDFIFLNTDGTFLFNYKYISTECFIEIYNIILIKRLLYIESIECNSL